MYPSSSAPNRNPNLHHSPYSGCGDAYSCPPGCGSAVQLCKSITTYSSISRSILDTHTDTDCIEFPARLCRHAARNALHAGGVDCGGGTPHSGGALESRTASGRSSSDQLLVGVSLSVVWRRTWALTGRRCLLSLQGATTLVVELTYDFDHAPLPTYDEDKKTPMPGLDRDDPDAWPQRLRQEVRWNLCRTYPAYGGGYFTPPAPPILLRKSQAEAEACGG